jgi:hypothetical protein
MVVLGEIQSHVVIAVKKKIYTICIVPWLSVLLGELLIQNYIRVLSDIFSISSLVKI